jgi:hypothetical protein
LFNPQKDEIDIVTKNNVPLEQFDPATAKKVKLAASTSSAKKSPVVSVKNPAPKKQRACKVLVPAEWFP